MGDASRTHGILMIVAWMFCCSLALFIARFYRHLPGQPIFGQKVWFLVHTFLMTVNLILTAASFILVFVSAKSWFHIPGGSGYINAHPYIGTAVLACVVINPILALCRPRPTSSKRAMYNWVHWVTGKAGFVLGVLNVFIGLDLFGLTLSTVWWLILAMAIVHYGMESIVDKAYLEYDKLPKPSELLNEVAASQEDVDLDSANQLHPGAKTSAFLYLCLGIYVLTELCLLISVVVLFP